ncbi:MAG: sigma-70 family RNA polymerase sigma factor [Pseudomonadota bacterium]
MKQEANDEYALVQAVLSREACAFEELVRLYQRLCWHITYRMVRDPDEARDLCQETFLRVHRQLHQFRFECPLKSWIGRIAYSIALRHLERRRQMPAVSIDVADLPDDETPIAAVDLEAGWADEELVSRVRAGVDALPPIPRTLLTLFHLEEMPVAEIALITGMSEGTIKSHLFRGRLRLKDWLQRRGVSRR